MDITIKSPEALEAVAIELEAVETIATKTEADALRAILTRFSKLAQRGQRIHIPESVNLKADYLRIGGRLAKGLMLTSKPTGLAIVDGRFMRLEYSAISACYIWTFITPEEVLQHHTLSEVLQGLSKAAKESADRLPKRLAKMKERESLAAAALAALGVTA